MTRHRVTPVACITYAVFKVLLHLGTNEKYEIKFTYFLFSQTQGNR